jgi:fructokinase
VKVDPIHPTGRVDVTIDALGQPSYQFEYNVAWDYLEFTESWELLASDCDAVGFGTIAQRSPTSRDTITKFLQVATRALRLFDVNLRQGFYSADVLRQSFKLASAAKLNIDELPIVCGLLGLEVPTPARVDRAVSQLIDLFQLEWLAVTLGPLGTVLYVGEERYEAEVPIYETHASADGVGAGDACGAGLMVATLMGWPYEQRVALANSMGAFVASQRGAIPDLPRQIVDGVISSHSSFTAKP